MGAYITKRYPINSSTWTPIAPPIHCDGFFLKTASGSAWVRRTNPDDPDTEDTLSAGGGEVVQSIGAGAWRYSRFRKNDPIIYVKSTQPDDVLVGTFLGPDQP